jgi:HD superfamily phosphohydrolase
MDYLSRDSFFTGVSEGVISYDRILKMLVVKNDELMIEEKGIYSIEKFLVARRLMYWQVYLHKAGDERRNAAGKNYSACKRSYQKKYTGDCCHGCIEFLSQQFRGPSIHKTAP